MPEQSSAPALGSTADTNPYVSVSWTAVGAAGAAFLFVGLLIALGVIAFREKKPLLLEELLILPVLAVVLSFAARKLIQNSEGTRTGILFNLDLVKSAWWVALVGGLAYSAYLLALSYSVRRDAVRNAEQWVGYVTGDDINRAFLRTLEPGRRASLSADDTARLEAEFREPYLAFTQADLLVLAKRNPGACRFSDPILKEWLYQPGVTKCSFGGTVKCPEGTFPIELELRGTEGGVKTELVGRQWAVTFQPGQKFILHDKATRTPYGWRIIELGMSAEGVARGVPGSPGFFDISTGGPGMRAFLYQSQINPTPDPELMKRAIAVSHARLVFDLSVFVTRVRLLNFDLPLAITNTPDYQPYIQNHFVRLRDGSEPSLVQKELFLKTWLSNGILPPGRRIKDNEKVDTASLMTFTDTAVEVRVPCEVPLLGSSTAARGRLVLVCTEPEVLAELKSLRNEANPDQGTAMPPQDFGKRGFRWRAVRIESDLQEVRIQQPGGPGGPGGRGP